MAAHFVRDILYGQIDFDADELKIFQTKELARLRRVSLSASPTWALPAGNCASKFEHSVGAAHLAKIVGKNSKFKDISKDLYFAALAHDIGTPPFSHISEYFQAKVFGKNHEQFAQDVIEGSEFAKEVKKQGGNIKRILGFIEGRGEFSDLINGTIDLDNLDNSPRYVLSMGILNKKLYSPEELAKAFSVVNGKLVLLSAYTKGNLSGWEKTRRATYEFVYDIYNLSGGTATHRALDFAYLEGELTEDYFFMTDQEALNYLATKCNKKTRVLMDRVNRWVFYTRAFNFRSTDISDELIKYVTESDSRRDLGNFVSKELKIPQEDVYVYMGKNKGFKQIHLPIVGAGKERPHKPKSELSYSIQVYVHPSHEKKMGLVPGLIREKLGL